MKLEFIERYPILVEGQEKEAWLMVHYVSNCDAFQATILCPFEHKGIEADKGPAIITTDVAYFADFAIDDAMETLRLWCESKGYKTVFKRKDKRQVFKPNILSLFDLLTAKKEEKHGAILK